MARAKLTRYCLAGLFALLAWSLSGCEKKNQTPLGSSEHPIVLLFSHTHTKGTRPSDLTALQMFLERETGSSIRILNVPTAGHALSALARGEAQVGLLPLFEYLLAHKEFGVEARLRLVRKENADPRFYSGQILVKRGSGISHLNALAGKKIAYVDEYSVSGYLLAAALFSAKNVKVKPEFAGSHQAALDLLRAGKVDAAAVYSGAAHNDPAFESIDTTARVPNEPFFVTPALDDAQAKRLLNALEKYSKDPEGAEVFQHLAHISGLEPITDAAYDEARTLISTSGRFIYDLVPGARGMSWANEVGWPL